MPSLLQPVCTRAWQLGSQRKIASWQRELASIWHGKGCLPSRAAAVRKVKLGRQAGHRKIVAFTWLQQLRSVASPASAQSHQAASGAAATVARSSLALEAWLVAADAEAGSAATFDFTTSQCEQLSKEPGALAIPDGRSRSLWAATLAPSHTAGWPTLFEQEWQDRSRSVHNKGRPNTLHLLPTAGPRKIGLQQNFLLKELGAAPYWAPSSLSLCSTRCPAATGARRALPARALIKRSPLNACTGVPNALHLLPTAGPRGNGLEQNRTTPLCCCSTQLEHGVVGSAGHPGTQRHQASFVTVSPGVSCAAAHAYHGSPSHCAGLLVLVVNVPARGPKSP